MEKNFAEKFAENLNGRKVMLRKKWLVLNKSYAIY